MQKIKNCPYCGSKPRIITRKCDKARFAIGCTNVDCREWLPEDAMLRYLHNYTTCYVRYECMIECWNRRKL